MPSPTSTPRKPRSSRAAVPRQPVPSSMGSALMVIDHARLQAEAWAEFHAARKRLDGIGRELHRHEERDVPAFNAWLHRHYPIEATQLRELRDQIAAKLRQIRTAQATAARTGASVKRVWREQKEWAARAEAFRQSGSEEMPEEPGEDADDAARRAEARPEDFAGARTPPRTTAAREIYRRLVRRLHPDRGGAWSPARQRLWHEIQQAWAAGDGDWLARLEVEWETAHDIVGPQSPLSRLRAAKDELDAAWRDTEAKLAEYRRSLPWRFTLRAARREALARQVEIGFGRDFRGLQRQLHDLNATTAKWEEDWTRADSRPKPRRSRRSGWRPANPGAATERRGGGRP